MDVFNYSLERTFHLRLVETPADGNCLFHAAVSALPRNSRWSHTSIRSSVVTFLRSKKNSFQAFNIDDAYLARMSREGSWGGEPELIALANIYMRAVEVYMFSPTGSAVHARTYTPASGMEITAPMRFALLPMSGRVEDAPNHYSYLEQVATVLGAVHVPSVPVPAFSEVDLTGDDVGDESGFDKDTKRISSSTEKRKRHCMEDVSVASLEVCAGTRPISEVGREEAGELSLKKTKTKVSYYKLYEHYLNVQGLPQACADLAARGEVAWYGCECGACHRAASFGSEVWEKIVCNEAAVKPSCKVWKPWSLYQTVVRPKMEGL